MRLSGRAWPELHPDRCTQQCLVLQLVSDPGTAQPNLPIGQQVTPSRQFMDKHVFTWEMGVCQVDNVAMVSEEQNLGSPRQLRQSREGGGSALIVEI
jgi:hypothetical protein